MGYIRTDPARGTRTHSRRLSNLVEKLKKLMPYSGIAGATIALDVLRLRIDNRVSIHQRKNSIKISYQDFSTGIRKFLC